MIQVNEFVAELEEAIQKFPDDFYSSFNYTKTGMNLTHPFTLGLISKILYKLIDSCIVAQDIRINLPNIKFQPDLAVYTEISTPLLFIDYESPNSSDSRIPRKDIKPFSVWRQIQASAANYYVITTLPNTHSPSWKLRYATPTGNNREFSGSLAKPTREKIRHNPFRFWYKYYAEKIVEEELKRVEFININRKRVDLINVTDLPFAKI